MQENENHLLKLEHICVTFPVKRDYPFQKKRFVHAVTDVSFEIGAGETFGLVGESGCGKSTLANTTLGIQKVDSGKIFFEGKELTAMDKKQLKEARRSMQMIFQDPFSSLNPRFSVFDIVSEPLRIMGGYTREEMREKVGQMLHEVGLSAGDMDRFPSDFSGGQKQRIGIARALILKPKYLVCDEPVSALDVSVHAQILNLLLDLQEKYHITYLFISHNLAVVKRICNRILVMYFGKTMEYGDVDKIFANPMHPYTRALMSAIFDTDIDAKHERIRLKGEVPSPINVPKGCRFCGRCPEEDEACRMGEPPLVEVEEDHYVACFHCGKKADADG